MRVLLELTVSLELWSDSKPDDWFPLPLKGVRLLAFLSNFGRLCFRLFRDLEPSSSFAFAAAEIREDLRNGSVGTKSRLIGFLNTGLVGVPDGVGVDVVDAFTD